MNLPKMTGIAALSLLACVPLEAAAFSLGVEAGAAQVAGAPTPAGSVGLRAGFGLPSPGVHLQPELGVAYARIQGASWISANGGLAVTAGDRLRPGAYAHFGFGRDLVGGLSGPMWDLGGVVELAVAPLVRLGARAGWSALPTGEGVFGVQLGVTLGF